MIAEPMEKITADGMILAYSPATFEVAARIPAVQPGDVAGRIGRARAAQALWAAQPLSERVKVLRKARDAFAAACDDVVTALSAEIGRPAAESYFAETIPNIELFDYWCKEGPKHLEPEYLALSPINYPGKRGAIYLEPRGVIGLISPWNFPVAIPLRAIVPALLAGNAVAWKPSQYAAHIGQTVADALNGALPPDLLTMTQGSGKVGTALCEQADMIVFIGSVNIGRQVGEICARRLIPVSLELGGKDAAYVRHDADLDRAANGVLWGAMMNCGQNCASIERVYVHEKVYAPFMERIATLLPSIDKDMGPLITAGQYKVVEAHVQDAIQRGAKVMRTSEEKKPGYGFPGTVLTDIPADALTMREETFGPLMPVVKVSGDDEALQQINGTDYGLTTSLWTRDFKWAESVRPQIRTGVVTINNHGFTAAIASAPWSGPGLTGGGVTNSHYSLHHMCRQQFYLEDRNRAKRELWWYPYNDTAIGLARSMIRFMSKGGNKLAALGGMIKGLLTRWK